MYNTLDLSRPHATIDAGGGDQESDRNEEEQVPGHD
jgi:hypothetical protein